jgi:hypothetical protein
MRAPHARGARMRAGVCFEPALALDYAQAHACLKRIGHADPAFDALLAAATRSQAFAVRERVPHRALEQCWVAELCGIAPPPGLPSMAALAAQSALGRPLDLVGGSREDCYAFTHALLYLKDPRLAPRRLPRPRADVLRDAEAALVRCLDEEDYDLAGELLLAWPLTRAPWSPGAAFAFRTLACVEDEAGFLPSPGTRLAHLERLEGRQRADCLLASAYHTVFVMGLLCAACLACDGLPPAPLRGAPPGRRPELPQGEPAPHWTLVHAGLAASEQAGLAGFVRSVALRRAVRARDAARIHATLCEAVAAGAADAPQWSQAAELLERIAAHALPGLDAARPAAAGEMHGHALAN